MKEIVSTISRKGQVTIPAEVRRRLGIQKGDKVVSIIEDDGGVKVVATRYGTVASLRGAAGKLAEPLSWEEMCEIALEDRFTKITDSK